MESQSTNTLFVVSEYTHSFAGREIPQSDCAIERRCNDLWICFLAFQIRDCAFVTAENVYVAPRPHVPYSRNTIAATCDENIECGME